MTDDVGTDRARQADDAGPDVSDVDAPVVAHDVDYAGWIAGQIAALRRGDWRAVDIEHLTDELRDVGNSERDEIDSRLRVLLTHLLKWHFQPAERSFGWRGTIREQRLRIGKIIARSPSLRRHPATVVAEEYDIARDLAAGETGLPIQTFPAASPYAIEQVLDPAFWPGPGGD